MKILVLSEEYPNNDGKVSLMYVHTRNLYYQNNGIDVTELNFRASNSYIFQGIKVITLNDFISSDCQYDVLILHAANIKHHYKFLKKYGNRFPKFIFFYHGHEVLKRSAVYSKPYSYLKKNTFKTIENDIYDAIKLSIWRKYIPSIIDKSWFVFVSKWMYDEFLKWTKIPEELIKSRHSITYNCVGKEFEVEQFQANNKKLYDFVTVRSNLDGSKYAIDLVNSLAKNTPEGKFLVVGKGEFFSHYEKADNIVWENTTLQHEQIVERLNMSRFALMPTRTDAQGLMMCEMAAFGIPVITSDIPVCHEVFDGFENVKFIRNDMDGNLRDFLNEPSVSLKDTRYYEETTAKNELQLINKIMSI